MWRSRGRPPQVHRHAAAQPCARGAQGWPAPRPLTQRAVAAQGDPEAMLWAPLALDGDHCAAGSAVCLQCCERCWWGWASGSLAGRVLRRPLAWRVGCCVAPGFPHAFPIAGVRPLGRRQVADSIGVPKGIRTPVTAVKGRCPGPLDDGDPAEQAVTRGVPCDAGRQDYTPRRPGTMLTCFDILAPSRSTAGYRMPRHALGLTARAANLTRLRSDRRAPLRSSAMCSSGARPGTDENAVPA